MVHYYMLKRPFISEMPSVPLPSYDEASNMFGEFALQYPGLPIATPRNLGRHRLALIKLRIIQHELLLKQHPSGETSRPLSFEEVVMFHDKLKTWCAELPECLEPDKIAFPGDMGLQ
jgi:hypothetical protein